MQMTPEEICAEYRQAKSPLKQIGILADLNQCSKKEITAILTAQGEALPGQYGRRAAPRAPELPEPSVLTALPDGSAPGGADIYRLAVDTIARLLASTERDDVLYQRFPEQVRGVLAMIREADQQRGESDG